MEHGQSRVSIFVYNTVTLHNTAFCSKYGCCLLPSRCRCDRRSRALWILSSRWVSGTHKGFPTVITGTHVKPKNPAYISWGASRGQELWEHLFVDLPFFQLVNPVPQQRTFVGHSPERSTSEKHTKIHLTKQTHTKQPVNKLTAGPVGCGGGGKQAQS